jgi:D-alanine-D-alanine ligase-like ATP-grasp enzyme
VVVTGNGRDSIRALVAVRNEHRSANSWLGQWPATRFEALESAGLSLDSVPESGVLIQLSNVVGITNGGESLILADSIHPSLLGLAERAVHCFPGLHLACVSLLCEDPAGIVADQKVVVVDIEAKPAIADLAYPAYGPAQDLTDLLLDYALDLAKHRQNPGQPPCIRPALRYVRPPDVVFAHNSSSLEQQILRHAARSRQLQVEQLSSTLTRISRLDEQTLFYKTMTSGTRVVARRATNSNKEWTKQLLRAAGLPTPRWHTFGPEQQSEAWNYLKTLKTPAVIKPVSGSWGRGVTANVVKQEHFIQAWNQAMVTKAKAIMVEEYFPGDLYRLLVIGNALVAVAEILPVSLTGDGEHTIEELVIGQNYQRELDPCLAQCPIVLSPSILHNLQEQGLNERSILDAGRALQLDTVANVGVGGTCRDMTDRIHPDFAPIAVQARKAVFDPPHVGIDLIARDIAIAPHQQPWTIVEVNTNPGLVEHHFPSSGQPRDVAGALLEFIFPQLPNYEKNGITNS